MCSTISKVIVIATAAVTLAGCNRGPLIGGASSTPADQQLAIRQNLAARAAWIKAHPTPGQSTARIN